MSHNKSILSHQVSKELRPLFKLSLDQGWKHERTNGNHMRWVPPGPGRIVHSSLLAGNSDIRALKNLRADLRRSGLRLDDVPDRTKPEIATGCCPHGVSYHDLAQGIEVCDDCIADKLPAVVTPPKLETTDIGDAIRSALHPEQTVYATTPDLSLLEQQVDRTNRVAEMCQVVETVLGAQPTKYFRTEQIMMQARGRVAGASRSEISYALRKLKMNGKIVNKRHGVWQWACITEMAFQFAEPKPPIDFTLAPSAPDVTYTEAPPMSVTPITSGQLNTAPLLAKPEPVADQADQELKDLDEALEAIVKLEKVVRKYRGLAKQLAALKAALNAVGEEP